MKAIPREEFPRPDFERKEWQNLNGIWAFSFDDDDAGRMDKWYLGHNHETQIQVPFVYQCPASGINDTSYHPIQWYERRFTHAKTDLRTFLCFGAVDYRTEVWVNGSYIGNHEGGYTPFSFDITEHVRDDQENLLSVRSEDRNDCSQPRGKQYWKESNDRCWYTPSSGIWQTVWLEERPQLFLQAISIRADIQTSSVSVQLALNKQPVHDTECIITISKDNRCVQKVSYRIHEQSQGILIPIVEDDYIDEIHYWTPETPSLYDIEIMLKHDDQEDIVQSYFGMRKIEIQNGHVLLNNKPLYQRLILDQAYWEESLLTAPSDDAFIKDIKLIQAMGFNGVRLHQKIEDPRFYYWADKLGLLVWAEMPSTYSFNAAASWNLIKEFQAFIARDMNHPCIICWVPLNESWGVRNIYANKDQQRFAVSLYHLAKMLDPTRLVDTNDGWEQVTSDLCGIHDYIRDGERFTHVWRDLPALLDGTTQGRMIYASSFSYEKQPILVTEFGGIAFANDMEGNNWGYSDSVESQDQFLARLNSLIRAIRDKRELQGFCYTQLTDVMQEVNGLLDISRQPKCSIEEIRRIIQG